MAQHYYMIRLVEAGNTRTEKAKGPREACKLAYGVIYEQGQAVYKDIGTRSPAYISAKKKQELHGDQDWLAIPKTGD